MGKEKKWKKLKKTIPQAGRLPHQKDAENQQYNKLESKFKDLDPGSGPGMTVPFT